VLKRGTLLREVHELNMLLMDVTIDVLNNGTVSSAGQLVNKLVSVVALAMLKLGTVLKEIHPLNIDVQFAREPVLYNITFVSE